MSRKIIARRAKFVIVAVIAASCLGTAPAVAATLSAPAPATVAAGTGGTPWI
jgi:hypothetical protein